jgi:RimJ/RimL family protein N-acetyltransferase
MKLKVGELNIELAPLTKESLEAFVTPGLQQASITRYLSRQTAPVMEDELEWFDKVRANRDALTWGIWVIQGDERTLIGNTTLMDIERKHIHQATSGSMIFDRAYWRKGIASHIHKARTWYAFQHMGLHRIMSAVIQGNEASRKALEKSGYRLVYVERNTQFVDGGLRHQDNLAVLNPLPVFWEQWWHGDEPDAEAIEARRVTDEVMKWAEENVELS